MKTGIVFEISDKQAILLTSDGQFLTVSAKAEWQKGDVVPFAEPLFSWRFFQAAVYRKRLSVLAACIILAFTVGLGGGSLYFTPVALVSIDVNPAVELHLNRFDKVVSMQARNESGEAILVQQKLINKNYMQAVDTLLQGENGFAPYLEENAAVVFTVYAQDAEKETLLTTGLQNAAESLSVQAGRQIDVECHAVDANTLESAHQYGVTAGKYLYLQRLTEADPSLHIEDYTHHTIKQLKEQIDACQLNHGQNAENGRGHHGHQ